MNTFVFALAYILIGFLIALGMNEKNGDTAIMIMLFWPLGVILCICLALLFPLSKLYEALYSIIKGGK